MLTGYLFPLVRFSKIWETNSKRGVPRMFGWAVFFIGVFDLVLGVYIRMGIWICMPIAISWYIILLKTAARTKREKLERKILAERIKERSSPDLPQS
jgi:hypothetical protein